MLMPKRVKYRKQQRGRMNGKAYRGSSISFGDYGLKVLEPGWLTDKQIEAARIAMTRFVKRGGKIWVRVFPDKPITKKPAETPHRIALVRKELARVLTVIREKKAGADAPETGGKG